MRRSSGINAAVKTEHKFFAFALRGGLGFLSQVEFENLFNIQRPADHRRPDTGAFLRQDHTQKSSTSFDMSIPADSTQIDITKTFQSAGDQEIIDFTAGLSKYIQDTIENLCRQCASPRALVSRADLQLMSTKALKPYLLIDHEDGPLSSVYRYTARCLLEYAEHDRGVYEDSQSD